MSIARGQHWEAAAGDYLESQGLAILRRGYRCRLGELDLVCRDGATLVVVEVRARASTQFGTAAETVTHAKRRRIILATRHLLMHHREWQTACVRFDVVAFDAIESGKPELRWIKNAFDAG